MLNNNLKRLENISINPEERLKNFEEFHKPLDKEKRIAQASRCMNCGVPFCQSGFQVKGITIGCPLHNYIPEWNKLIANNQIEEAYNRLMLQTSFPEFTGRVCPALCEAGCTQNLHSEPVTVRDNELFIVEEAFKKGFVKPRTVLNRTNKKIAVIGSGPSGLAVSNELNMMGHNVTVYERNDRFGGLLMYGIPNMKLDKKVISRRLEILKAEGIEFVSSFDASTKENADFLLKNYDAIVLATGSTVPRDLSIPGRDNKNILFAVDFLKENTKSLLDTGKPLSYITGKDVIVIGGGDTGNDCCGTCFRLNAKSVTQFEIMPCPPEKRTNTWPEWSNGLKVDYGAVESIYLTGKDQRIFSISASKIEATGSKLNVYANNVKFEAGKLVNVPDSNQVFKADYVILAMGFVGNPDSLLSSFGLCKDRRGNIISENYLAANKVFACGDCRTGQSLVVKAINDGRLAASKVNEYLSTIK